MNQATECVLRVAGGHALPPELALALGDEVIIGRSPEAGVRLEDRHAEWRHARVTFDEKGIHLVDLGSKRGVQVNGKRRAMAELVSGDQIRVGSTTLRVLLRTSVNERAGAKRGTEPHELELRRSAADIVDAGPSRGSFDGGEEVARVEPGGPLGDLSDAPPLELQHVWFQVRRDERWRSLAVVPADRDTPTLPVVHSFARMAALNPSARVLVVDATTSTGVRGDGMLVDNLGAAVREVPGAKYDLLDASALGLNDAELAHVYVPQLLDYIQSGTGRHNTVLLALGSLLDQATSIPIARAVDSVLISVGLGRSRLPDIERLVEIVGRERVAGCVAME